MTLVSLSIILVILTIILQADDARSFHIPSSMKIRGKLHNNIFPSSGVDIMDQSRINNLYQTTTTTTLLNAAPKEALSDIVVPGIFEFTKDDLESTTSTEDPRIWVPQTECLSFRPLCFCVSQGYYVNLLKFKGGGVLGKHRHSSPVHALTLKGSWGYKEHEWNAKPGTYVFEPPGETHTLVVDEDCEEMITMFHVTGTLLYVGEGEGENDGDEIIGFDDVFSKLEKAKKWYKECGLGEDYVQQFVR